MRSLPRCLLLALSLAACGGGASRGGGTTPVGPADNPPTQASPCATMAAHVAAELKTAAGFDDEVAAAIERIANQRCTTDGWSAEAIACYSKVEGKNPDPCDDTLTDAQNQAIEDQMERELAPLIQKGDKPTESAPPPAPAPDDPCGGGA